MTTYSCKIYKAMDQCPLEHWNQVCQAANAGIFMHPGFATAAERAFARENQFWHLILYDEMAIPAACASVCTFTVDLVTLAGAYVKKTVEAVRRYFPAFLKLRVLFCGLPVSAGQNHLAIKPGADINQVLQLLDRVLTDDLARREKAHMIIYKEFDDAACELLKPLAFLGYYRAESPATYLFQAKYTDFGEYCRVLNSHYRYDIRRSQRKFERAGLSKAHLCDPTDILQLYDDHLHRLYEAVVEKSDMKLEKLPIEFFHSLVRQFPNKLSLTLIRRDSRVVAFNWGLYHKPVFYFLFCGIDYRENADADLYFNLMYHQLDYALGCGPEYISVGQTADSFKARLGCRARPLYFFAKGRGPLLSRLVLTFAHLLFPKRPPIVEYSIFKRNPDNNKYKNI